MPETTPLIKAALNLRVGVGFDVYGFLLGSIRRFKERYKGISFGIDTIYP